MAHSLCNPDLPGVAGLKDAPQVHSHAFVHQGATLAAGTCVQSGAFVCDGVALGQGVHIGPNVVFVETSQGRTQTRVEAMARIGANSTIYPDVAIGEKAEVRPGSVVTRSVPPGAIVEGNPASIVGYVGTAALHFGSDTVRKLTVGGAGDKTAVAGVAVFRFALIPDMRGALAVYDFEKHIPFAPKRSFIVFDVPSREVRGEHAHHRCHQFLVCIRGSCAVVADDGREKVEVDLDSPSIGVYLPPLTWGVQYKYSADAMLLVFASDHYDPADYIRNYSEFLTVVQGKQRVQA
ncbi:MAG: WxcM-like domain-containing protein [Rhodoferax sp.]|nr:WxcM-like domain-containing protein [Rhodoferax sp.]